MPTPGVFVFDLPARGLKRLGEIAARAVEVPGGPNSMNRYGRRVEFREDLQSLVMLAREMAWNNVDARVALGLKRTTRSISAFTIEYDASKQRRLERHVDSSDVTLNVCIGGEFTGGNLICYARDGRTPAVELEQRVGRGFIHLGKLMHRAKPIESGWRKNIVCWWRRAKT